MAAGAKALAYEAAKGAAFLVLATIFALALFGRSGMPSRAAFSFIAFFAKCLFASLATDYANGDRFSIESSFYKCCYIIKPIAAAWLPLGVAAMAHPLIAIIASPVFLLVPAAIIDGNHGYGALKHSIWIIKESFGAYMIFLLQTLLWAAATIASAGIAFMYTVPLVSIACLLFYGQATDKALKDVMKIYEKAPKS